jgi:carboxymethylenebutenolidase
MCFDDDSRPPVDEISGTGANGSDLRLTARDGADFMAYLAEPGGRPAGSVIILPDIRGLHTFYKELAIRFAEIGYRALAVDFFGRTAETDDRSESFEYMPHVVAMTPESFGLDLQAAVDKLREETPGADLFTVGFCYGGSLSFWSGTQGHNLAGVVGFYAGFGARGARVSPLEYAHEIACPVLGLFGGSDESIPQETLDQFEEKLNEAGIPNEIVVYPGAPHSFFDRKAAEFNEASSDAWLKVQGFLKSRLA